MARPNSSKNLIPSRAEQTILVNSLRSRATQGDSTAAGELIRIAIFHAHVKQTGVTNELR